MRTKRWTRCWGNSFRGTKISTKTILISSESSLTTTINSEGWKHCSLCQLNSRRRVTGSSRRPNSRLRSSERPWKRLISSSCNRSTRSFTKREYRISTSTRSASSSSPSAPQKASTCHSWTSIWLRQCSTSTFARAWWPTLSPLKRRRSTRSRRPRRTSITSCSISTDSTRLRWSTRPSSRTTKRKECSCSRNLNNLSYNFQKRRSNWQLHLSI